MPDQPALNAAAAHPAPASMSPRRVLVVDDDEDMRTVIKLTLELTAGWQVVTASSGVEGLRKAADEDPDAILLDVIMPGLDGPATLKRLRAAAVTREVPVIFLTATAPLPERQQFMQLGVAGVIAKPFDHATLAIEVAAMLGWDVRAGAS